LGPRRQPNTCGTVAFGIASERVEIKPFEENGGISMYVVLAARSSALVVVEYREEERRIKHGGEVGCCAGARHVVACVARHPVPDAGERGTAIGRIQPTEAAG